MAKITLKELEAKLRELAARNEKLEARIGELEQQAKPAAPAPAPKPVAPAAPPPETISEETMLVIAAAVAAYLGERAHIRVVRLVPSHAWAQQGRVSIQASHHLT